MRKVYLDNLFLWITLLISFSSDVIFFFTASAQSYEAFEMNRDGLLYLHLKFTHAFYIAYDFNCLI